MSQIEGFGKIMIRESARACFCMPNVILSNHHLAQSFAKTFETFGRKKQRLSGLVFPHQALFLLMLVVIVT